MTLLFPADFDFETGRNHEEQDGADGEVEDIADQGQQFPPGVEALRSGQGDVDQEVHARDPANDRPTAGAGPRSETKCSIGTRSTLFILCWIRSLIKG
jgi:hypothetical protein